MTTQHSLRPRGRRQFGLSIVELLIGIAVGLFVLAGATMVASNQVADNKRLLLETQVQQDLRTAMDVIVRDVRRSGFSYDANLLHKVGDPASPTINGGHKPAGIIDPSNPLIYSYSRFNAIGVDNNGAADLANVKGFRWQGNVIQVQLGSGNWQALTDPDVVKITQFAATSPAPSTINLPTCDNPGGCPAASGCGLQHIVSNHIDITMTGQATHDPSVTRTVSTRVRLRNDEVCL